jgi:tellurite resistance protein TehA-like permease
MSGFATMQSAIMIYTASPHMRGRVLGSVAVFIGLGPLGQLGIGALASILNPATAVLITASIGIICMFIAFVIYPAMSKPDSMERDTANG